MRQREFAMRQRPQQPVDERDVEPLTAAEVGVIVTIPRVRLDQHRDLVLIREVPMRERGIVAGLVTPGLHRKPIKMEPADSRSLQKAQGGVDRSTRRARHLDTVERMRVARIPVVRIDNDVRPNRLQCCLHRPGLR